MKKNINSIFLLLLRIYVLVGIFLYIIQDSFLYFPPQQFDVLYKKRVFINEGESISTTVLNFRQKQAIIYFGGNAENVDYNINNFKKMFKEYTVYLVKYRGYGASSSKATEKALYSDALSIYDTLEDNYHTISVIGRSLGSGVATYLASKREISKLALITPFDSIESIAQEMFPIYPMSLLLRDKYKSIDRVNNITANTLILMAENDKTVTSQHTKNLANKFPASQVHVEIIRNEDHNSISNNTHYNSLLQSYFSLSTTNKIK